MTATNHALTGALIGLTIGNPLIAVPVAFASHFVLDAIPHYDPPGDELHRIGASRFRYQLLADATLCFLLVVALALIHPRHWLTAAVCAFAAASPDFMWIPKFLYIRKHHVLPPYTNIVWRFHSWIQWCTSTKFWVVEALWAVAMLTLLIPML